MINKLYSCHLHNYYYTFSIVLFLTAKFWWVIIINNFFNSIENTYYKKLANIVNHLSEFQCNLNKTPCPCYQIKRRNTYSCKKLFIVPSGLFNFKVNSLFSNGLSRSVKPWQPMELQLGREENHHLIHQCQNGSSEWVCSSQYHAKNNKLNITYFSSGYSLWSILPRLFAKPSLGVGGRGERGRRFPQKHLTLGLL